MNISSPQPHSHSGIHCHTASPHFAIEIRCWVVMLSSLNSLLGCWVVILSSFNTGNQQPRQPRDSGLWTSGGRPTATAHLEGGGRREGEEGGWRRGRHTWSVESGRRLGGLAAGGWSVWRLGTRARLWLCSWALDSRPAGWVND